MNYQIKHYSKDLVLKNVINPNIIKNKISFTKQINWWVGQFVLLLDLWIENNDYIHGDIIKVAHFESWIENIIYVWLIDEVNDLIWWYEEKELRINWLASLFSREIYNISWNYEANINQDPYVTIQNIVTFVNLRYNYFTNSWSNTWVNANYDLNWTDCNKLINDITWLSANYYWYLDNFNLIFEVKPSTATHRCTLKKDIIELNNNNDWSEIFNRLILKYKTATATYNDTTSQTNYWIREKYINNSQIVDVWSANIFWANYLLENANPKKKTSLSINTKYAWFHNINPWESCKILNCKKQLWNNLIISKINYNQDIINIDIEGYDNFINLIKK